MKSHSIQNGILLVSTIGSEKKYDFLIDGEKDLIPIRSMRREGACERAQVEFVKFYASSRHTTAINYAMHGHEEVKIERMLGQSTPGMSRKYVKRSVEMLREMHYGRIAPILLKEKKRESND